MGLFGSPSAQNSVPVDAVRQLRAQNTSDHEIIDTLSKQGYSSIDIYNALNQADQAGPAVIESQPSNQPPPQQPQQEGQAMSSQPDQDPWSNEQQPPAQQPPPPSLSPEPQAQAAQNDPWAQQSSPPPPPQPPPVQSFQSPPPQQPQPAVQPERSVFTGPDVSVGAESIDQIDQIAEAIIDEKWKQLKAYIEKIVDWKGKVEARIIAIEQNQKQLGEQIIGLQKSLVDKVQTYDRHITDVGTEIKAMEKVFQKIIPSLTENVNELSNVVHRMKDDR